MSATDDLKDSKGDIKKGSRFSGTASRFPQDVAPWRISHRSACGDSANASVQGDAVPQAVENAPYKGDPGAHGILVPGIMCAI